MEELIVAIQYLFFDKISFLEKIKLFIKENKNENSLLEYIKSTNESYFDRIKKFIKSNEFEEIKRSSYITILSSKYPERLKEIYGPPLSLFFEGNLDVLTTPLISIVGTRKPTEYGIKTAKFFSKKLSFYGLTIVSGFAVGIDTIVFKEAFLSGKTVAVLGSGLKKLYPASNKKLFEKAKESDNVCFISEFPPKYPAHKRNFPQRNRLIAGFSPFTLIVEAGKNSGSLITAHIAIDSGRDVGAIPGRIDSSLSEGTNYLIKNGAYLIENPEDILEILPYEISKKEEKKELNLSQDEEFVFSIISQSSRISFDSLMMKTSLSYGKLFSLLTSLKLKGIVIEYPGKIYERNFS